jgi:hypothetical protein
MARMNRTQKLAMLLLLTGLSAGCGKTEEPTPPPAAPKTGLGQPGAPPSGPPIRTPADAPIPGQGRPGAGPPGAYPR